MANVIVGTIVIIVVGSIVFSMIRARKKNTDGCSSSCGSCPFSCEKRH
ncbi:MAG: FeoB-associated Cys-rich membrane protein [Sphaerochaetaceae bacterium]